MPTTPHANATVTPTARLARGFLIACAVAAPLAISWLGVHVLALHLEGLQPDGDLEAGGNFAIAVLLVELVLLTYAGSLLMLFGLWRWAGRHPSSVLLVVACTSVAITCTGVALNWQ